ncbi:MAG: hypothetical protein ACOZNI_30535 [Myxococcota bacterium]
MHDLVCAVVDLAVAAPAKARAVPGADRGKAAPPALEVREAVEALHHAADEQYAGACPAVDHLPPDAEAPGGTGAADSGVEDRAPTDPGGDTGEPPEVSEVPVPLACYLGPARDHSTSLEVVDFDPAWGDDYDYPEPCEGSTQ